MSELQILSRPMTFHKTGTRKIKKSDKKNNRLLKIIAVQTICCAVLCGCAYTMKTNNNNEYNAYKKIYVEAMSSNIEKAPDNIILKTIENVKVHIDKFIEYMELMDNKGGENSFIPKNVYYGNVILSAKPISPLDSGYITSDFGERKHPISNKKDFHTGIDIASPQGSSIYTVLPGIVEETGNDRIYGNYIKIRHSENIVTIYNHCDKILAETGAKLRQGERIATVGSTGISTGSHLHLTVMINNNYINPISIYEYL